MPHQRPETLPYNMRRTFSYNIVLLFTIFLVNNVSFSQDATLTGKVRYGSEALHAATISLGNQTILTDGNGAFTFSVKPATYKIIITHAGYKKIEQTIIAEAGSTKNVEFDMIPNEQLDEVKLGSRSAIQRSNLSTAVPVDVFSSDKLVQTAQLGLVQALTYLAPSLNTGKQEFNEPVTLRGLAPDQLLILVNGTRRHNAAYQNNGTPKSSLGRGSVNNDLNAIPFLRLIGLKYCVTGPLHNMVQMQLRVW
jgi:iron complex outermembrane receptor protein